MFWKSRQLNVSSFKVADWNSKAYISFLFSLYIQAQWYKDNLSKGCDLIIFTNDSGNGMLNEDTVNNTITGFRHCSKIQKDDSGIVSREHHIHHY